MRLASYLALASCIGVGGYWLSADGKPAAPAPTSPAIRTAKLPAIVIPPALPASDDGALPVLDDVTDDVTDEGMRGHETITDPAEFAMVFQVGDEIYLRLSAEERATSHGAARMIQGEGAYEDITSVIAPVTVGALPAAYRSWANREVVVDGDCRARVIGFAEVSRVAGDAGDPYAFDDDGNQLPPERWTIERVTEAGVTLAAKLDGCAGTWARAADWSPAAVAARVEAPSLEEAALDDLLAMKGDELAASWKEQGGEGTWRENAEITTSTWQHPLTNERWIFVQAYHGGSCGEPGIAEMAVYRAGSDGKPRFATSLDSASVSISDVVDLDGDGQPEFLSNHGDSASLHDLTDTAHDSIYIPRFHYGCGC